MIPELITVTSFSNATGLILHVSFPRLLSQFKMTSSAPLLLLHLPCKMYSLTLWDLLRQGDIPILECLMLFFFFNMIHSFFDLWNFLAFCHGYWDPGIACWSLLKY